jgi:hypothetical protein
MMTSISKGGTQKWPKKLKIVETFIGKLGALYDGAISHVSFFLIRPFSGGKCI